MYRTTTGTALWSHCVRGQVAAVVIALVMAGSARSSVAQAGMLVPDEMPDERVEPNPTYDGRYAFARLRYTEVPDDPCTCPVGASRGPAGWQHDYPEGERNLMKIATDFTTLNAWTDSSAVFTADNPQLMRYPILYLSEPACWRQSDAEVRGLRTYLLKGGFLIADDFTICTGGDVRFTVSRQAFEAQIRQVLPGAKFVRLALTDPALNVFFKLDSEAVATELQMQGPPPEIYGVYDRNDVKRRLLVVANYNTVIHRFWVWEAQGRSSVARGNQAYKLGVNYLMYGLTH